MQIEISIGELVDKVTVLQIKSERIKDKQKLINVNKELEVLNDSLSRAVISVESIEYMELKKVNEELWEIEDNIRIKEKKEEFDKEFVDLARSVYFRNDVRAEIKKKINLLTGSDLVEEKEYVDYNQK